MTSSSARHWLDALEDSSRLRLTANAYDWVAGGAGEEQTLRANPLAWKAIHIRPDAMVDVSQVDLEVQLLGSRVAHPVGIAPSGFHGLLDAGAESATASAAHRGGALFVLSSRSTMRIEDIELAGGPWWYQTYLLRSRDVTRRMLERAAAAGARAIVLTVDTPVLSRRRRDRDDSLISAEALQVNTGAVDDLRALEPSPAVRPSDIDWVHEVTGLPVVVKGVLRADTARRALDHGAAGLWVSNHGGRQLDGSVSTADALLDILSAVPEATEVYVDGGIRSGTDALRALAAGARAVFLGRPPLWGLGAAGADGVTEVVDRFVRELTMAMQLVGRPHVGDLTSDLLEIRR